MNTVPMEKKTNTVEFTPPRPRRKKTSPHLSQRSRVAPTIKSETKATAPTTPPPTAPPSPSITPMAPETLSPNLTNLPAFLTSRREAVLRDIDLKVSDWEATLTQMDHPSALTTSVKAAADLRRTQLLIAAQQDLVRETNAMWDSLRALQGPSPSGVGQGTLDIIEICRANCMQMAQHSLLKLTDTNVADKRKAFEDAFQADMAAVSKSQMKEVTAGFGNMCCQLVAECSTPDDLSKRLEVQVRTSLRAQALEKWVKYENQAVRLLDYIHVSEGNLPTTVQDLVSSEASLDTLKLRHLRDITEKHCDDLFQRCREDLELVESVVTCLALSHGRRSSVTSVGSASSLGSLVKPPLSPLVKASRELSHGQPARGASGQTAIRAPTVNLLRNM